MKTITLFLLLLLQPYISLGQCTDGELEIEYIINCYGYENSFTLNSTGQGLILSHDFTNNNNYNESICLDPGIYTFTLFDTYGDGQAGSWFASCSDGSISLNLNGQTIFYNSGNWGDATSHTFIVENIGLEGCTDENYFEYNNEATVDDGSCSTLIVPGCTDEDYLEHWQYIELVEGIYEIIIDETYLEPNFEDGSCETLLLKGCLDPLYLEYNPNANTFDASLCETLIVEGCTNYLYLEFNIAANVDNGSCETLIQFGCISIDACNYNEFANTDDGSCDYVDTNENGICDSDEEFGCTYPEAINYNPISTADDGSCIILGCTYSNACNYNTEATSSDGSCIFPESGYDCNGVCLIDSDGDGVCDDNEIFGCTDELGCNYDPEASENEACTFPEMYYNCQGECNEDTDLDGICDELEIIGCLDTDACNYNENSTDEGACTYATEIYNCEENCWNDSDGDNICDELEIVGCTDLLGCNYNPDATDDGSCEYPEEYYDCSGDCINDNDLNGICDELEIEGCTDPQACNYNPMATMDIGNCEYVEIILEYDYSSLLLVASTSVDPPNYQWSINGENVDNNSDRLDAFTEGIYTVTVYDEENDCWGEASYTINGVSINEFGSKTCIFPNPVNSILNINLDNGKQKVSIEIFNLIGELCYSDQNISSEHSQINLSKLASGSYIIHIQTKVNTIQKEFVKY